MGLANDLVQEMLWWREGLLENTEEWTDLVQYHLGGNLPVLLHSRYHDYHRSSHTVFRAILCIV
jgi:hypothetical protein